VNVDHRMYRVPKRVVRQVEAAVLTVSGVDDIPAVRMAEVLMSGVPVDASVPRRVTEFFTRDWRFHASKADVAGLYGGLIGLDWAQKCVGPAPMVAAATEDESYADIVGYSHEDVERLIAYGKRSTAPRWAAPVDEDAMFEEWLAELEPAGVEMVDVAEQGAEAAPVTVESPGVEELLVDDNGEEFDPSLDGLTVAAMRDAIAAASASVLASEDLSEGAVDAGDGADPKVWW